MKKWERIRPQTMRCPDRRSCHSSRILTVVRLTLPLFHPHNEFEFFIHLPDCRWVGAQAITIILQILCDCGMGFLVSLQHYGACFQLGIEDITFLNHNTIKRSKKWDNLTLVWKKLNSFWSRSCTFKNVLSSFRKFFRASILQSYLHPQMQIDCRTRDCFRANIIQHYNIIKNLRLSRIASLMNLVVTTRLWHYY